VSHHPRLYHTTSLGALEAILDERRLAGGDFVSLSEIPFVGDIRANDVSLGFAADCFAHAVRKVRYTRAWYDENPEDAAYIAGDGWREQFVTPDDCYDDEGEVDEGCEAEAYAAAEFEAFIDKAREREWLSVESVLPFALEHIVEVVVHNQRQADAVARIVERFGVKPHT
jgi:hypothetical protein